MESEKTDSLLFAFAYNLDMQNPKKRCKGIICLDDKTLYQIEDDSLLNTLPLSDLSEVVTDMGVGCSFFSYRKKTDGQVVALCRADAKLSKNMIKTAREINLYLEDGTYRKSKTEDSKFCPKCGKPYRRGSRTCLHCGNKSRLLKRTWQMISPYKLFVFMSVAMFFVISGLRLLLPYINRVAVDGYILSKDKVNLNSYVFVLLSIAVLEISLQIMSAVRSHLLIVASNKMTVDLRNTLFDKIQRLSLTKISAKVNPFFI